MSVGDAIIDREEVPAGLKKVGPDDVFSHWRLWVRAEDPVPDKPLRIDVCHAHTDTVIEHDYVVGFVYDVGFGKCDLCRGTVAFD